MKAILPNVAGGEAWLAVGNETEITMIGRAQRGDDDAFRHLVMTYESRLVAFLVTFTGDREAARDLAQETFVAAFRALGQWRPPSEPNDHPLAPWLYRIATNRALTYLRREAIYQRDPSGALPEPPPPTLSLEERAVTRELLRQALARLTEPDAACLVLHIVMGERYGEIAARLGITPEAARKRVARGLASLRVAYHELDQEARS